MEKRKHVTMEELIEYTHEVVDKHIAGVEAEAQAVVHKLMRKIGEGKISVQGHSQIRVSAWHFAELSYETLCRIEEILTDAGFREVIVSGDLWHCSVKMLLPSIGGSSSTVDSR